MSITQFAPQLAKALDHGVAPAENPLEDWLYVLDRSEIQVAGHQVVELRKVRLLVVLDGKLIEDVLADGFE